MIYVYKCDICKAETEIDKPRNEQYQPECCQKLMRRIYTPLNTVAGILNRENVPNA